MHLLSKTGKNNNRKEDSMRKIKIYLLLFIVGLLLNGCTRKEIISEDEAKRIVLNDVNGKDAQFINIDLDLDGEMEYELRFIIEDIEYEYSINAYNGKILEKSSEKIKRFAS